MNTFIQFINRKKELEFLERQIKNESSFVVIYGRRRVGKSELLKRFVDGKKAIYLNATQEVEKELIESFSSEVANYFQDNALKINPFSKFSQLAEYLKEKDLNSLIVVIDEFPYLVDSNKAVPSILQKYWDNHFKAKGLNIIVCGSSIGSMETEVLGRKSPLYGRRTGQWKIESLLFKDFIKFFPKTGFQKLIELYSISGGVPLYILEFDKNKSIFENAKNAIASRGSMLYQEAEFILKEELREPRTYFSILKEMSAGKNSLNEISNALNVERTSLVRYINTLIELDLAKALKPLTEKEKNRNAIYVLNDNYLKFWFKFIYPFKKDLDSFSFDSFQKNFKQTFNYFVSLEFENVCREALQFSNIISPARVGKWWGHHREEGNRKEIEIDIMAVNDKTNKILFAECKWQEKVNPESILNSLRKKVKFVQWKKEKRKEYYVIFAKSFKNKKSLGKDIFLFDLKDIEKTFKQS